MVERVYMYAGGKVIDDNLLNNENTILVNYKRVEQLQKMYTEFDDLNFN